jgi:hypothetical protein
MPLRVIERVWDPDASANADGSSEIDGVVVLLDGAAPVAKDRVSSYENDTVWLVRRFPEYLAERLAGARATALAPSAPVDIPALAEAARVGLAREYAELCRQAGFLPAETPFACLAIAYDAGARLELFNLGDQTTLVRGRGGRWLGKLGESAVRELDRQALELLMRELRAGVEPHAARHARIRPAILANRALRNQLVGYDVLDVNISCRERFEHQSFERAATQDLLMMTDGFYRLVDTFGRYDDASLFRAVERNGLAALLAELRSVENDDPECTRHPRFKRHDDATALWVAVETFGS